MSLLKAFERNVERRMSGVPIVKIVPRYKLVAEEATVELQKEIKTAQVKIDPDEIRRLVADSQAALLMEEVGRLRGIVSDVQSQSLNLLAKFDQYRVVTEKLAEETVKMAAVRSLCKEFGVKGTYIRDAQSVERRWAAWKQLHNQGMTAAQIANRYGVADETVKHAMKKNWIVTPYSRKPKTKGNHESK